MMTSSQQDHVILVKRYTSISGKAVLTKFRAALGTEVSYWSRICIYFVVYWLYRRPSRLL